MIWVAMDPQFYAPLWDSNATGIGALRPAAYGRTRKTDRGAPDEPGGTWQ